MYQISQVLSGRMLMIAAGVPHELRPGDSFYIGSNVPHRVETFEDTTVSTLSAHRGTTISR